jgi:hypothetical protein
MEYCAATKREEILLHMKIPMYLENIILSERSQRQKATYSTLPFLEVSQIVTFRVDWRYWGQGEAVIE